MIIGRLETTYQALLKEQESQDLGEKLKSSMTYRPWLLHQVSDSLHKQSPLQNWVSRLPIPENKDN